MANDQLANPYSWAELRSISGAPEGIQIVSGRSLRIPSAVLEGSESITFEYTIVEGGNSSTATVTIDVLPITREQFGALVESVVARAAEDFGVEIDTVSVAGVEPHYDQNPPNICVTVTSADRVARYSTTLDGDIEQMSVSDREALVNLSLRATDEDGNVITEIHVGDFFRIEFTAKDLRINGAGVFAAFLDLKLPADALKIAGEIEHADNYARIGQLDPPMVTESSIDSAESP